MSSSGRPEGFKDSVVSYGQLGALGPRILPAFLDGERSDPHPALFGDGDPHPGPLPTERESGALA
jgi:hypothetical protein